MPSLFFPLIAKNRLFFFIFLVSIDKPFTLNSLREIHEANNFKDIRVKRFKQLPILWKKNKINYSLLNILSEITRVIVPSILKKKFKWVRFSKEIMLFSVATK